jgi:epoxyqueuosine reductase QueG
MSLNKRMEEFLVERGAIRVGFASLESLAGGPPSAELEYTLAGARSAVSFALPLDRGKIRAFLAKEDRFGHEEDNLMTNLRVTSLSWEVAEFLKKEGFEARGTSANLNYRKEMDGWQIRMHPKISHRYVAVASGLGSFGWSGNAGLKGYGAAVILGTCVTGAELEPTPAIPDQESFCDGCKLCVSACPVEMFDREKAMSVTLGSSTFSHADRKSYLRCQICCGGFTGLHKSRKWSSWSPGRLAIPDDEQALYQELLRAMALYEKRPRMTGGYRNPAFENMNLGMTCGNCQIVCWGDRKETAENVRLLHNSGCVLEMPGGGIRVLPGAEAADSFEKMAPEHRSLYC